MDNTGKGFQKQGEDIRHDSAAPLHAFQVPDGHHQAFANQTPAHHQYASGPIYPAHAFHVQPQESSGQNVRRDDFAPLHAFQVPDGHQAFENPSQSHSQHALGPSYPVHAFHAHSQGSSGQNVRRDDVAPLHAFQVQGGYQAFANPSPPHPQHASGLSYQNHSFHSQYQGSSPTPLPGQNDPPPGQNDLFNVIFFEPPTGSSPAHPQQYQSSLGGQQDQTFLPDPRTQISIPAYSGYDSTIAAVPNTQGSPPINAFGHGTPSSTPIVSTYSPGFSVNQNPLQASQQGQNSYGSPYLDGNVTSSAPGAPWQTMRMPGVSAVSNPVHSPYPPESVGHNGQTSHGNLAPSHLVNNSFQNFGQAPVAYQGPPMPTGSPAMRNYYETLPNYGNPPSMFTPGTAFHSAYQQAPTPFTSGAAVSGNIMPAYQQAPTPVTSGAAVNRKIVPAPGAPYTTHGINFIPQSAIKRGHSPSMTNRSSVLHTPTRPSVPTFPWPVEPEQPLAPTPPLPAELNQRVQSSAPIPPTPVARDAQHRWSTKEKFWFFKELDIIKYNHPLCDQKDLGQFMGVMSNALKKRGIERSAAACRYQWRCQYGTGTPDSTSQSGSEPHTSPSFEDARVPIPLFEDARVPIPSYEDARVPIPVLSHQGELQNLPGPQSPGVSFYTEDFEDARVPSPVLSHQGGLNILPGPKSSGVSFYTEDLEDARVPSPVLAHQWELKNLPDPKPPGVSFNKLRNRATRIQNDQDQVFEGLPIRNWRKFQTHVVPPSEEHQVTGPFTWPELPMPDDSHLLGDMSRQILRISRAPHFSTGFAAADDEEKGNTTEKTSKNETRNDLHDDSRGFTVKKWGQMPKGYEAPDREYLAKRRKGLPPLHAGYGISMPLDQSKTYRTLKVRRADANGVEHVYEVMAEVGQAVEGEILEGDLAVAATVDPPAAPGTIIEGVGVVNSDGVVMAQRTPKRKPVPPRRKKKGGPGRSKKKLVPEVGPEGVPVAPPDAAITAIAAHATTASDVIGSTTVDTEMPDAPGGQDDEEDSGEEGEEMDEDDEREEGEISATSTPTKAQLQDPRPPTTPPSGDRLVTDTMPSAPHPIADHINISTGAAVETASNIGSTVAPGNAMSQKSILKISIAKPPSSALSAVVVPPPAETHKLSTKPMTPTVMAEAQVLPAASAPLPVMEPDAQPAPAATRMALDPTTPPALIPDAQPGEAPAPLPISASIVVTAADPAAPAEGATGVHMQRGPRPATNKYGEVLFEDGEVDLLGSLEAQLNRQGARSARLAMPDDAEEEDESG